MSLGVQVNYLFGCITEFMEKIAPYTKSITHVHVSKLKDGRGMLAAPSKDRSVNVQATTKQPLDDLQGVACLGNLLYLRQILKSSFIRDSEITLTYRDAKDNRPPSVNTVQFSVPKKSAILYQATDPFMGNLTTPVKNMITEWPVSFILEGKAFEDMTEMNQIQAASSVAGEVLFELIADKSGVMTAMFGKRTQSSLVLTDQVDRDDPKAGFSAKFITDHFIRLGGMQNWKANKEGLVFQFCDKAVKAIFDTPALEYEIVLSAKKAAE